MTYSIRPATVDDADLIVHHRHAMFEEMGVSGDYEAMDQGFLRWLRPAMHHKIYLGWMVETGSGEVVAGGGLAVLPWPPGPTDQNREKAYVYNVYTEPAHRRQGLARLIMETIHEWCRARGIRTVALHASEFGRPLYEALGYEATNEMTYTL
jgi:GNAT superfamily N-acetyltransferase